MSRWMVVGLLFLAVSASGQTLTVAPPTLTTATRVRVTFNTNSCAPFERLVRNGDIFDVEYHIETACIATPPLVTQQLDLGFLPAGTYTVRAVNVTNPAAPVVTETVGFAVAQAPAAVPALDAKGIAILALAIGISASLALRRAAA